MRVILTLIALLSGVPSIAAEHSATLWAGAAFSGDTYKHYLVALSGTDALPGASAGYVIISGERRCFIELTRSTDAEGRIVLSGLRVESEELTEAIRADPCTDYGNMPRPEEFLFVLDPASGSASVFERGKLDHEVPMTVQ